MKKIILILFILINIISLSGCWNYVELDDRALVAALGIDIDDKGEIELSVQVINANELSIDGGTDEPNVVIFEATGRTLFEAVRNITHTSDKKLFFQHNQLIVFGEDAAKSGLDPFLDFFIRDHESRARTYIAVTKGKAADVISAESTIEKIPAQEVKALIEAQAATSTSVDVTLHELQLQLTDSNNSELITCLVVNPGFNKPAFEIKGSCVLKHDKLVGRMGPYETRGANWINGDIESGIIVIEEPDEEKMPLSLEIIKADSKVSVEYENEEFSITVKITGECNIGDEAGHSDFSTNEKLKELEKMANEEIKEEIKKCLLVVQKEYKSDIFGFNQAIRKEYPHEFKEIEDNWEEVYESLVINLSVEMHVIHTGLIGESIHDK